MSGSNRLPDVATMGTDKAGKPRQDFLSLFQSDTDENGHATFYLDLRRGRSGWKNVTELNRASMTALRDLLDAALKR